MAPSATLTAEVEASTAPLPASGVVARLEAQLREQLALEASLSQAPPAAEPPQPRIAADASALIGNTPLVYLNRIAQGCTARIAAKLEWFNPAGSVKDRIALSMILDAEQRGLITPGHSVLVEGTSGNTGIALAAVGAQRGYRVILVMPDACSVERRMLMLQLGAKVVLTDKAKKLQGVLDKVDEIVRATPHAWVLNQLENLANPSAHLHTTGPEIWRDTAGQVDIFVASAGTAGTVTGVSQYLKARKPSVHTVVVEPAESRVLSGGPAGPHKIQGTGLNVVPPIIDRTVIDEILPVTSDDAIAAALEVARTDGLLVGISAGSAIQGALEVARREENAGRLVVVLLPSGGERYLSTELYEASKERALALAIDEVYDPST